MGNESSNLNKYPIVRFYRAEDWIKVSFQQKYQIWKHKYTHETVEVYRLPQLPDAKNIQAYQFRAQHEEIVKVLFLVC